MPKGRRWPRRRAGASLRGWRGGAGFSEPYPRRHRRQEGAVCLYKIDGGAGEHIVDGSAACVNNYKVFWW